MVESVYDLTFCVVVQRVKRLDNVIRALTKLYVVAQRFMWLDNVLRGWAFIL